MRKTIAAVLMGVLAAPQVHAAGPVQLTDADLDRATAGLLENFALTIVAPITVITNIVNSTAIGIGAENVTSTAIGQVDGGNATSVTAGLQLGAINGLSDGAAAGMLNNMDLTIVVPITVVTNEVNSTAFGLSSKAINAAGLADAVAGNATNTLDLLGI